MIVQALDVDRFHWAFMEAMDAGFVPQPLGGNAFEVDDKALDIIAPALEMNVVAVSGVAYTIDEKMQFMPGDRLVKAGG